MVDAQQLTQSEQPASKLIVHLRRSAAGVVCCWLALATPVQAADRSVYRCEVRDQPVLYSQFVCPPDRTQHLVRPGDHSIVAIPMLSAEESVALASLEQSLRANRADQRKNQRRAQQSYQRELQQAASLCDAARVGLEEIRTRKRQGYNAAQGRKLEHDRARLQAQKKANC